jgi:hypothetical protein
MKKGNVNPKSKRRVAEMLLKVNGQECDNHYPPHLHETRGQGDANKRRVLCQPHHFSQVLGKGSWLFHFAELSR